MQGTRTRTASVAVTDSLIEAALAILEEAGLPGLTVRDVASRAGVAPMGVYSRFGSKDGLLEALFMYGFASLQAAIETPPTASPLTRLRTGCQGYRRFAIHNPQLYHLMFEQMYAAMPNIQAGKTRALAITSKKRLALVPDLMTMEEAGVPGFEVLNWQGAIAPKGTPAAIIQRLNTDINKVLVTPEFRDRVLAQGNELGGGTPEQFGAFIKSENAKWGGIVRVAKITAD